MKVPTFLTQKVDPDRYPVRGKRVKGKTSKPAKLSSNHFLSANNKLWGKSVAES